MYAEIDYEELSDSIESGEYSPGNLFFKIQKHLGGPIEDIYKAMKILEDMGCVVRIPNKDKKWGQHTHLLLKP
jgi:hypothetical protein